MISVAEYIVKFLEKYKVKHIFGLPSRRTVPLIHAIGKSTELSYYSFMHEQSAAFAASGYAKISGKTGVTLSESGPGATNLITGLMDAAWDHVPVVAIIGQLPPFSKRRQAFSQTNWDKLFSSFAIVDFNPLSIDAIIPNLVDAFLVSKRNKGVAVVRIPSHFFISEISSQESFVEVPLFKKDSTLSDDKIDAFTGILKTNRPTVIVVGRGGIGSSLIITKFAEKIKSPIVTSLPAIASIPIEKEYALGTIGPAGTREAAEAASSAERVILLGTSYEHREFFRPDVEILQIDIDPYAIGLDFKVRASIVGDISEILREILKRLDHSGFEAQEWLNLPNKSYDKLNLPLGDTIYPENIFDLLNNMAQKDAVFVADTGSFLAPLGQRAKFTIEQAFIMSAHLSSAGFGLPGAIGIQINDIDRQVIAIVGDAGLSSCLGELSTVAYYNIPIKIIVVNNEGMKIVDKSAKHMGFDSFTTRSSGWNFANIADQLGIRAFKVTSGRELEEKLSEMLMDKRFKYEPMLLEVMITPGLLPSLTSSQI